MLNIPTLHNANELINLLSGGVRQLQGYVISGNIAGQIENIINIGERDLALLLDKVPQTDTPMIRTSIANCKVAVEKLQKLNQNERDERKLRGIKWQARSISCDLLRTNSHLIDEHLKKSH